MSLSSKSTKQSSWLGRMIGTFIAVIAALLITALLLPFIFGWLHLPMPSWLFWGQSSIAQVGELGAWMGIPLDALMPDGEVVGDDANDSANDAKNSDLSDGSDAWPTPPSGIMASSGFVTTTVASVTATPQETPTPFPTSTTIILPTPSWEEMSYLTSVKFTASTIVEAERATTIAIFGDITTDRLLLKAVGEVLVGIDLSRVSNVDINGRMIRLSLPAPEVMTIELLPKESQIYDTSRTLFLSQYDGLESDALEQARRQLRIEVVENEGLMEMAQEMSRLQLIEFLESVGFQEVEIEFPYLGTPGQLE